MNILVVGFGNMGCRHVQSLLVRKNGDKIFVLETNNSIIDINKVKIGVEEDQIIFINKFEDLPFYIDFAIIATSAFPRFGIVKNLLEIGIKKFLLEKIVFQSEAQFDEIIKMLEKHSAIAYCNFVNRYFPNYQIIKNDFLDNDPLKMIVSGGEFGLGCNALHYIDLFEYLSNDFSYISSSNLVRSNSLNRRGNIYKEVNGQIQCKTAKGDSLLINSDIDKTGGVEIILIQGENIHMLNEESLKHIHISKGLVWRNTAFILKYTSELTNIIVNDVLNNNIFLPTVQETKNCHVQFFSIVNDALGLSKNDLCPIT